ncbi:oligosaccharide flippase family protein [Pirellulaceae bacterium]|jgi:O-antigen/teichoic acid export membrane protein|nr:oligosaccharide flippase family protein [Pirellulaceae bacterium]
MTRKKIDSPPAMNEIGNDTKSLLRGSVILVAGRIFALVVNFGVQVATIRYLPKAEYGILAFAISVVGAVSVVCLLGLDKTAGRYLSVYIEKNDSRRFWGSAVFSFVVVSVLGFASAISLLIAYWWEYSVFDLSGETMLILAVVSGLVVAESLNCLFEAFFAALGNVRSIFMRRHILSPLLKIIAAFIVIILEGNLWEFATGQLLAGLIGTLICVPITWRVIRLPQTPPWPGFFQLILPVRKIMLHGGSMLIGDLGFLLRGAIIPILIGIYFEATEVADYQSVFSLARLNQFVLLTFSILFIPHAARLSERGNIPEMQSLFESATLWIMILSFPFFSITFLGGDLLPILLFGGDYRSSGSILGWLAIAFFVNAAFGTSLRLIRAVGQVKNLVFADIMVTLFSLLVSLSLIPRFGALGAAYSMLASYLFQAMVYQIWAYRFTSVNPFSMRIIAPFLIGVVFCLGMRSVLEQWQLTDSFGILAAILVSAIILILFAKKLAIEDAFPELGKLPFFSGKIQSTQE